MNLNMLSMKIEHEVIAKDEEQKTETMGRFVRIEALYRDSYEKVKG